MADLESPRQRRYRRFPRLAHWANRLQGTNREPEMKVLDILCDPAKDSVDVGAKLGMYTYRLLRHSRAVVAFEPNPVLVGVLRAAFAARPCRVEPFALSDGAGDATLRIARGADGEVRLGRSTIEPSNRLTDDDVAESDAIDIERRTLDGYDLREVGFVKIDVEGHELAVLAGATGTLARERPNLLVEANDVHRPGAVAALRAFLADHDYVGHCRAGGGLIELGAAIDGGLLAGGGIENFLCVHRARPDVVEALRAARALRA